jgi:putative Holliday junction resolvase
MRFLALDIGDRHTGAAFADALGVPMPLETIHHSSEEELVNEAAIIASERTVDGFVIGLPYRSDGTEGDQAKKIRDIARKLCEHCPWCELHFIDERWTTKLPPEIHSEDPHAQAAVTLLQVFLERQRLSSAPTEEHAD